MARKNFYGSGAEWSGELACACFTLLATLRQHGLCPRKYFQAYLEACARAGGRAPENLEEFLPWKWSADKRAANQAQGRPPGTPRRAGVTADATSAWRTWPTSRSYCAASRP